jgi:TPR repeat protein
VLLHPPDQLLFDTMYDFGKGVLKDAKQAAYWYQKAAEQGYAKAQYNLGAMYDFGKGVLKDDKQSAYWYPHLHFLVWLRVAILQMQHRSLVCHKH